MPEIISRDRVQVKLQEFDERLDGALAATEIMMRVKNDVVKLAESIQETQEDSAKIQWRLQQIQEEWEELKVGISATKELTEESRNKLLERFDQTREALEVRFSEAAQKLYEGNTESFYEHSQFVEASRTHAEKAAKDSDAVFGLLFQAEQLVTATKQDLDSTINGKLTQVEIVTDERLGKIESEWKKKRQAISADLEKSSLKFTATKESLHAEIDGKLTQTDAMVASRLGKIENEWKERVGSLEHALERKLVSFREEVKNDLVAHQQGVERQITEFLIKQNMLIQNLTQQVDGFQRATQTLSSEQQTMTRKIGTMEEALGKITAQEAEIGGLQKGMQDIDTKLVKTITRLQGVTFIGSSFRGL